MQSGCRFGERLTGRGTQVKSGPGVVRERACGEVGRGKDALLTGVSGVYSARFQDFPLRVVS